MSISNQYNYTSSQVMRQAPPKIDSNNDQNFDKAELEKLAEKQAAKTGSSFDVNEVMSNYDVNEDGLIDSVEQESLKADNGLNMPDLKDIQAQMMSSGRGRPPRGGMKPQGTDSVQIHNASAPATSVDETAESLTSTLMEMLEELEDETSEEDTTSDNLEQVYQVALDAYAKQTQVSTNYAQDGLSFSRSI